MHLPICLICINRLIYEANNDANKRLWFIVCSMIASNAIGQLGHDPLDRPDRFKIILETDNRIFICRKQIRSFAKFQTQFNELSWCLLLRTCICCWEVGIKKRTVTAWPHVRVVDSKRIFRRWWLHLDIEKRGTSAARFDALVGVLRRWHNSSRRKTNNFTPWYFLNATQICADFR